MVAKRFVVACGGTGGHMFPGLAVARELKDRGHEVAVWASGRAIESSVLKAWDGPVFSTRARPLHPKYIFSLLLSRLRCGREMKRFKPHALLAMGSYASLPPVMAANSRRVPVILHEANMVPGRAVGWLARYSTAVAITFAETSEYLRGRETVVTGLPVRGEIAGQPRFDDMPSDKFCVFVTGGSQGAHRVNDLAVQALILLQREIEKQAPGRMFQVIHQTGVADEADVKARYAAAGIPARVQAFEHEMGRAFATADLVICRAGASTCFELALVGKPAFFIPLPTALRNHQHYNALSFVKAGGADEGIQDSLTPRAMANYILHKILHPDELAQMALKMHNAATPDAAAKVADLVEQRALA